MEEVFFVIKEGKTTFLNFLCNNYMCGCVWLCTSVCGGLWVVWVCVLHVY